MIDDLACRSCGYLQCSCSPFALPTPEQAVEGAPASIVAQALRELGRTVERDGDGDAYVVNGERVEASEMWTRFIDPIVGAGV